MGTAISADRTKVTLTYSESLYTGGTLDKTKFAVTAGTDSASATNQTISSVQISATDPNTVELQLSSAIANNLTYITVSYTNSSPNNSNPSPATVIQDPSGNDALTLSRPVPITFIDTVLPVLRSVILSSVSGVNKLIMTYSEPLNNLSNFTEGIGSSQGTAVPIFSTALVSAGETNQKIVAMTLSVSGLIDAAAEIIYIDGTSISLGANSTGTTTNGISYSVTSTDVTATVALSKPTGMTAAEVQTLLTGMTYQNTRVESPSQGVRVFDITSLTDNSGTNNATTNFAAGTNSASVLVSGLNDAPYFKTNTAPAGLTTSNSQGISQALNIPLNGYQIADADGNVFMEQLIIGITDLVGSNPAPGLAPLNFNFPNKPTSMYLTKTSDNTYSVYGRTIEMNEWLSMANAVTYNPRSTFTGTTSPISLKITDAYTTSLLNYATTTFTINVTADKTAPTFKTAVLSTEANNKIILSYDEPLDATALPAATAFAVSGTTVSGVSAVGSNLVLTTSGALSGSTTVSYTDPVTGTAYTQDAAGNHASSFSAVAVGTDTTAPTLTSSPVFYNGNSTQNKFLLYFNEELSAVAPTGFSASIVDPIYPDRTSASANFSLTQSGGSNSYSEKALVLSLNSGFLSTSASVQITYADPTTGNDANALQDLAGNDAPNMVFGAWTNDVLTATASSFVAGKTVLVIGGQGNDTMTGGPANDVFTWFAGDAGTTGAVDVVKNFSPWNINGVGDKLDISKLLSNYTSGTSTLSQWVTSLTGAQTSPNNVSNSIKIVIDVDGTGSGTVTQTIWLENLTLPISGTLDQQLATLKTAGILIA